MVEQRTLPEMLADIKQSQQAFLDSVEQVTSTLERMRDEDLRTIVEHIKYGTQTLAEFIQHFIVEHDQVHVGQVRALLA